MDLTEVRDYSIFGGKKSRLEVISVLDKDDQTGYDAESAAADLPPSAAIPVSPAALVRKSEPIVPATEDRPEVAPLRTAQPKSAVTDLGVVAEKAPENRLKRRRG